MTDITPERLAEIKERVRFAFATAIGLMSAGSLRLADAYIQDVPDLIAALEAAQAENIKLREALETFAASENWQLNGVCDPNSGNFEGQSIARAALETKP